MVIDASQSVRGNVTRITRMDTMAEQLTQAGPSGGTVQKKEIHVVGAVVRKDGKILCAQRGDRGSLAGMWEFPGGKIEAGETARDALVREITEELECRVNVGDEITTTVYEYDFGIVSLTTFYSELLEGEPVLTEHSAVKWLAPAELRQLEWAPADIPAVELIEAEFAV